MNRRLPVEKLFALVVLLFGIIISAMAQESDTTSQGADQVANYKEQIKRLVGFFEFSLNTLGDPETSTKEKEVIINESYLKAFMNDKVQIEDDLDENREMVTHKDVQAYLKDVDFFFEHVTFHYEIQDIQPQTNDEGMLYFKVTANRQMQGVTVEGEQVNNTKVRYIEVNLDDEEQVLKIASIYTTRINEKEELMTWWNQLPSAWKEILGGDAEVTDSVYMKDIEFISDTTLGVVNQVPEIHYVDTLLVIGQDSVHIQGADTLYRAEYDTIMTRGTMAFKLLLAFPTMEYLDISGNLYIRDLEAVEQLTGLKVLNFSNTLADNLFPVRNLTQLEVLDLSGTPVTDISPVKYNIKIRELYLDGTNIHDLDALDNLSSLETLHFNNTRVDSLQALSGLTALKDLRFENCPVTDLGPLGNLTSLEILDLAGSGVTDLSPVQYLVSLKMIYIENTGITDLAPLSRLNKLQVLDLDNTSVNDLDPLKDLESLQKIYCDQSGVRKNTANAFMLSKPGVIVIYESEALTKWWSEMSSEWKSVFRKNNELGTPPSIEQLHELTLMTSVDVSGMIAITSLEPLSKLTNLSEVRCSGSSVSDLTPLTELIDLTYLDCSNTRIDKLLPLQSLVHLKTLDISGTLVTDLAGLEGASGLETLIMDNTQVDNLEAVINNKNLKVIYCDGTRVGKLDVDTFQEANPSCLIVHETPILEDWWTGLNAAWIDAFKKNTSLDDPPTREQLHILVGLNTLDISGNKTIQSLLPLTKFSRLEKLDLSNAMVSDIRPLSSMISLKDLNLSGNPINDLVPLATLTGLVSLDISNTPVAELDPLDNLANLEYLNCSGTPIKKLNPIETLFQLRRLEINNTNIKSLKPVESLVALRQLKCFNTSISSKNIEKFKEANPQVEVVYY